VGDTEKTPCRETSVSKYLKKGMHLVYLDQCVLSRFLDKPKNQQWIELRDLVLKGNAARKILCPTSLEHLIETSMLPDAEAIFLDELMGKLSFGWALSDEFLQIARQIIAKLRNRPLSRAEFLEKHLLRPITYPGTLVKLREVKAGLDHNNAWTMQGVNEFNNLTRGGRKAGGEMLQILIKLSSESYVKKLLAEVSNSLLVGRVVVRVEEHNDKVLNWTSKVVYELITKHRLALEEGRKLCQLLKIEGLNFIPTLKIKAELHAMQLFRREKIEPRDQYDITRAACALPYADIFITDGGKASAIRELKLDVVCKTEVFSMKKSELPKLTARLKEIVN
jgi:hypothetical protein